MNTIPQEVQAQVAGKMAIEAGFGFGPACCVGKIEPYQPPVALAVASGFLDRYAGLLTRGHVMLADRTVLWFSPRGFDRYDTTPRTAAPRPGLHVPVKP